MKKYISCIGLLLFIFGCRTQKEVVNTPEILLVGKAIESELRNTPYSDWYVPNYENHIVSEEDINTIKPLLKNVKIKAFMGTWCSDSKREVPKFFKIMDVVGYSKENIELITMTRKKDTPENYEEGLEIIRVPTFIFYKNNKELNRFVEDPIESLEKDIIKILSGIEYKNAYAE